MEKRKNQKTRTVGNGEGSLYYSDALQCWIFQYFEPSGKRKTLKQKKKETIKDFKTRVTQLKNELNSGAYIEKSQTTVISLAEEYVKQKYDDGITTPRSYRRDLDTIEQIKKTCSNFCNIPIQNVTLKHIQIAKKEIKKYSNNAIDKIWIILNAVFKVACSSSRKILIYNIMQDTTLVKPISEKPTKVVKPLSQNEFNKLIHILDNEEKYHKYRNIVKMQTITAMRIGEVLARSRNDYDNINFTFNVHNTLTQDENYKTILGKHTKTYNKKTQIDEGQRFLPLVNKLFIGLMDIIEIEINNKLTNMYNLLFWDYKKNTFITPIEINSWLKRLNDKYHICEDNLSSHRIRHTVINVWDKEMNVPMPIIQYLAGHVEGSNVTKDSYLYTSFDYVKKTLKNF